MLFISVSNVKFRSFFQLKSCVTDEPLVLFSLTLIDVWCSWWWYNNAYFISSTNLA